MSGNNFHRETLHVHTAYILYIYIYIQTQHAYVHLMDVDSGVPTHLLCHRGIKEVASLSVNNALRFPSATRCVEHE